MGLGNRRQAHLLRRGQPELRSRRALHDGEPAQGHAGNVGRRKLGRHRPGDGSDHLADGRSERLDRHRPGERRERGRVRRLDGRRSSSRRSRCAADDVRPRRDERQAALVVRERRIRQRRARRSSTARSTGARGTPTSASAAGTTSSSRSEGSGWRPRGVPNSPDQKKEAGETIPGFLQIRAISRRKRATWPRLRALLTASVAVIGVGTGDDFNAAGLIHGRAI